MQSFYWDVYLWFVDIRRSFLIIVFFLLRCLPFDWFTLEVSFKLLSFKLGSGDLKNENAVLEWLIQHRSTGEEGEVIEEATVKSLEAMVGTVDKVVVLFCE